jgi:uncharacterized protein (TIGR00251 family)
MNITIRVVPRSSRTGVKKQNSGLKVYLSKPAYEGQANAQLLEVLAEYFRVKKYQIKILKGETSRNKLIQIDDAPESPSKK